MDEPALTAMGRGGEVKTAYPSASNVNHPGSKAERPQARAGRHSADQAPDWAKMLLECLKENSIRHIVFLPDTATGSMLALAEADPSFNLIAVHREEEAVGVLAGLYLGGERGLMSIQSPGLGNSLNALGSLALAYRIPFPILIAQRGELGEFNPGHLAMGRAVEGCLDAIGIQHFTLRRVDEVKILVTGALKTCMTAQEPLALLLSSQLTGWKNEG